MWSAGLVIWQLWQSERSVPFARMKFPWDVRKAVLTREDHIKVPRGGDTPRELTTLLEMLWATNPGERPSASDALELCSILKEKLEKRRLSATHSVAVAVGKTMHRDVSLYNSAPQISDVQGFGTLPPAPQAPKDEHISGSR